MKYNIYWGDMHCNIRDCHMDDVDEIYESISKTLDFLPVAYYPFYVYDKKSVRAETVDHEPMFDEHWEMIRECTKKYHKPGEFVTFMGYEWHGDRTFYGDHNVFYFDDEQDLNAVKSLPELYEFLHKVNGIAIPHHTAYKVNQRGKDWDYLDEAISPFAEIFSVHGSSEGINTPYKMHRNSLMGPREAGGSLQDGLKRGHHFGIIGSGDSHNGFAGVWGTGLIAACAKDLTRESLWDAFKKRRVYGVSGDRIKLGFEVNSHEMGSVVETLCDTAKVKVTVKACNSIDRIEIIKNNIVTNTYCHQGTWEKDVPSEKIKFKQKISFGWGPSRANEFLCGDKNWIGNLEISGGKVLSVEPCFTERGQSYAVDSDTACSWNLVTKGPNQRFFHGQALIVEFEANSLDTVIKYHIEGREVERTARECLENSKVIALLEESKQAIEKHTGLTRDDFDNPDLFYQSAHKAKISKAVPEISYVKEYEWEDTDLDDGENYYYVRVSQTNGQVAWSSPVWVTKK